MSDQERGAYTPPTDAPLSFDARQPVRGARPVPYTLIIGALVLITIAALIFIFYRSGARQAGEAPQVVGDPVGAMRVAPPAESQPQDPAAGLQIYRSEPGQAPEAVAQPQFAAPPEQPQPRVQAPAVVLAPPAAAPSPPPSKVVALPAAAPPPAKPAMTTPAPLPVTRLTPPPPAVKAAAPAPKVIAPTPKTVTPTTAATGGVAVQIGAYSSQALADKGWADATRIGGGAGKGKSVQKIDKDGATLYRTAVTGFATRAAAAAFCEKFKAAGKSCFLR